MAARTLHLFNSALLALLLIGSLWLFPTLPDQIPRHFGVWGMADAYWETTLIHWMLLPIVGGGTVAIMYGAAWLIGRSPSWINTPNQERYDALDAADKRDVVAHVQVVLYLMAASALVFVSGIQAGLYQVAVSSRSSLPGFVFGTFLAFVGVIVGGSAWLLWWLPRRVRRLSE